MLVEVAAVLGGLRHRDQVTLVLEYCEHLPFREYYLHMHEQEIREYMSVR